MKFVFFFFFRPEWYKTHAFSRYTFLYVFTLLMSKSKHVNSVLLCACVLSPVTRLRLTCYQNGAFTLIFSVSVDSRSELIRRTLLRLLFPKYGLQRRTVELPCIGGSTLAFYRRVWSHLQINAIWIRVTSAMHLQFFVELLA